MLLRQNNQDLRGRRRKPQVDRNTARVPPTAPTDRVSYANSSSQARRCSLVRLMGPPHHSHCFRVPRALFLRRQVLGPPQIRRHPRVIFLRRDRENLARICSHLHTYSQLCLHLASRCQLRAPHSLGQHRVLVATRIRLSSRLRQL